LRTENSKFQIPNSKFDFSGTLAAIGALCCWSTGPIIIKYLSGYLDFWTQNFLRYSVACLFWLPFLLFSIRTKRLDTKVWRKAVVPALANVVMQSFFACAFYYIDPAFMVLLAKSSALSDRSGRRSVLQGRFRGNQNLDRNSSYSRDGLHVGGIYAFGQDRF